MSQLINMYINRQIVIKVYAFCIYINTDLNFNKSNVYKLSTKKINIS